MDTEFEIRHLQELKKQKTMFVDLDEEFQVPEESRISRKLVNHTNQIVICIIFLTLLGLAFLQAEIYVTSETSYE